MAVANCFTYEEAIDEIRGCLFKVFKNIERLVIKMIKVSNKTLCKMDIEMIRKLANDAYGEVHQACNIASGYVQKIQSECEKLTEDKGKLQRELADKKGQLDSLWHQLSTIKVEKEMNKKRLQDAESSLRLAEAALQKAEEHEKSMEIGRNVGIRLLFIPFVGPILGAATVVGCEISRQQDLETQLLALCDMCSQQGNVLRCISDLNACFHNIDMKLDEITLNQKKIQALDDELKTQQELLKKLFETDSELKTGITVLNELAGKVEMLKTRSEKFLHLDVLIIVVGDIVLHASHLPNRQGGKVLCPKMNIGKLRSLLSNMKKIDCCNANLSE
ncbi:uncharacterized protein LOC121290906 [Carcharodon carcharias]|uniref:uncharacterized protein LOC121290906 n=1 Tax=Carcharodon carcharias TaxID=13397 RepID=UPI001B7DA9DB|nr:uncharacterized protein LOC121290906 [Carcharodon carcharias]